MALPPEPFDPALDDAVLADVEGDAPYLRYAVWLRERGDPRGDLILEQLDGTGTTVFLNNGKRFLGTRPVPEEPAGNQPRKPPLEWHAGFLRHAAFLLKTTAQAQQLTGFLSLRSARFLRSLDIEVRKGTVDFSASPALPLRRLRIHGGETTFRTREVTPETLESIGRAGFDRLEDLFVSLGDSKDERLVAAFEPVLRGGCPSLRRLHVYVQADALSRSFVERLAASPLLARLESLVLIRMAAGAEEVVIGRAEAFSHLKTMHVETSLPARLRLANALPDVGRLRDGLPSSTVREAGGPAPADSPFRGAVPLAACDGCASEDVAVLSYAQAELHSLANNQSTETEWTVHCRRCNKITAWSGMFA